MLSERLYGCANNIVNLRLLKIWINFSLVERLPDGRDMKVPSYEKSNGRLQD